VIFLSFSWYFGWYSVLSRGG